MGQGATAAQTKRKPVGRADDANLAPDDDYSRVPPEYQRAGGWRAVPRSVSKLFGGKLPSGFMWEILMYLNALQLIMWGRGDTFEHIPGTEWNDGRTHRIATDLLYLGEIAKAVGCSLRTVEEVIPDFVERGVVARRFKGKRAQYSLLIDAWDRVPDPPDEDETENPPEPPETDEQDEDDDMPEAAKESVPFRVSGSERVAVANVRAVALDEAVSKRFEVTAVRIAGELRIVDIRSVAAEDPAPDCGMFGSNPHEISKPVVGSVPSFPAVSRAAADYAERASAPVPVSDFTAKHWRDTVNDISVSVWKVKAGPALAEKVMQACSRVDITPLEFLAYCDTFKETEDGKRAVKRCGSGILTCWADELVGNRQLERLKAWEQAAARTRENEAAEAECRRTAEAIVARWGAADEWERGFVRDFFPDLEPREKGDAK